MDKIGGVPQSSNVSPVSSKLPQQPDVSSTEQEKPKGEPGFFERLKLGLKKTKDGLIGRIDALVLGKKEIDADTLEELEEILITSDIGVKTTVELIRALEQRLGRNELKDGEALRAALKEEILTRLEHPPQRIRACWPTTFRSIGDRRERRRQDHNHRQAGITFSPATANGCSWRRPILSARRPPSSLSPGGTVPAWMSFATRKVPTRLRWFLTLARLPWPAG